MCICYGGRLSCLQNIWSNHDGKGNVFVDSAVCQKLCSLDQYLNWNIVKCVFCFQNVNLNGHNAFDDWLKGSCTKNRTIKVGVAAILLLIQENMQNYLVKNKMPCDSTSSCTTVANGWRCSLYCRQKRVTRVCSGDQNKTSGADCALSEMGTAYQKIQHCCWSESPWDSDHKGSIVLHAMWDGFRIQNGWDFGYSFTCLNVNSEQIYKLLTCKAGSWRTLLLCSRD